jgi:hypothetical protein
MLEASLRALALTLNTLKTADDLVDEVPKPMKMLLGLGWLSDSRDCDAQLIRDFTDKCQDFCSLLPGRERGGPENRRLSAEEGFNDLFDLFPGYSRHARPLTKTAISLRKLFSRTSTLPVQNDRSLNFKTETNSRVHRQANDRKNTTDRYLNWVVSELSCEDTVDL